MSRKQRKRVQPAESNTHSLLGGTTSAFRSSWKSLFLTDVIFKVLAFIVLTPLVGVLFRTLIAISGNAVVSDLDNSLLSRNRRWSEGGESDLHGRDDRLLNALGHIGQQPCNQ